ncbi:MAG: type II toxin-antitoxin system HicA family toxin [Chloroflexota bacterium]
MTKLPVVSGAECIKALQRLGYRVDRTRGSHVWLVCPGKAPVPVPKHHELGRGILRKIIKTADITVDEFIELLER